MILVDDLDEFWQLNEVLSKMGFSNCCISDSFGSLKWLNAPKFPVDFPFCRKIVLLDFTDFQSFSICFIFRFFFSLQYQAFSQIVLCLIMLICWD